MATSGRLNAYIDPEIYKSLKIYAATNDKTITRVLETAIKEYLDRNK